MTRQETLDFLAEFNRLYKPTPGVKTVICPPFVWLDLLRAQLPDYIGLGAQNLHYMSSGAYTGEISAQMLKDCGCQYVIIGHSERRQMGETDEQVRNKAQQAISLGLVPLICVGEVEAQRNAGQAVSTVTGQLEGSLADLEFAPGQLIIAYEPVWAIGTGKTALAQDAQEMSAVIRAYLRQNCGQITAEQTLILYGGSVTPDNAAELMAQPDIDGALVGGASLNPVKLWSIVEGANRS